MKILLINPGIDEKTQSRLKEISRMRLHYPVLGLPYLAALSPEGVEIEIIDEEGGKISEYKDVDLVGITAKTAQAKRMYEIADTYKSKGIPVVLGGIHVTFNAEEAMNHADSVVIGEAEEIWPKLLKDFENNKLQKIYKNTIPPSIENLPPPRLDLCNENVFNYPRGSRNVIMTTRGCPYNCSFCTVRSMFGDKIRKRPIEKTIEEILMFDNNFVLFYDDNFFNFKNYAVELLNALKPLNISWGAHASLKIADDDDLLQLVYDSGCKTLIIGVESLNTANNPFIDKTVTNSFKSSERIKKFQDLGIKMILTFIVGFDNDTEKVFDEIFDFVIKNKIELAQPAVLTPFPGTQLYTVLSEQNRIVEKDWNKYNLNEVVFEPKNMSIEKLQEKYDELIKSVYRYGYRKMIKELNI